MFDPKTTAFLETGCSLVVATASSDGDPYATRGWGLSVLDAERGEVRLLLDAVDTEAIALLGGGARVAFTATSVLTLRSVQLKGRARSVEAATAEDRTRADAYADAFFADVEATDGYERPLLRRLLPRDYVRCMVVVEEIYDQTPGPGAGAPLVPLL